MKKIIIQIGMFILLVHSSLMGAPNTSQPSQQPQLTYHQQLYQQILIQEDRAAQYLTKMQINQQLSGKFREAEKMLEVKQILFKNFGQSPALANPSVRAYLLELMTKEKIQPEELLKLQTVVNKELQKALTK